MRRFTFPYEKLLGYRQSLKQTAERELAAGLQAQREAEQRLGALRCDVLERQAALGALRVPGRAIDIEEVALHTRYLGWLARQVCRAAHNLLRAGEEVERLRGRLREARSELLAVEKLKEQALARHQAEARRDDQNVVDEIVLGGFVRRQQEEELTR